MGRGLIYLHQIFIDLEGKKKASKIWTKIGNSVHSVMIFFLTSAI